MMRGRNLESIGGGTFIRNELKVKEDRIALGKEEAICKAVGEKRKRAASSSLSHDCRLSQLALGGWGWVGGGGGLKKKER